MLTILITLTKTKALIKQDYSINELENKITEIVRHCILCILINWKRDNQEGYLQSIDKNDTPLSIWHVDFMGSMTSTPK